MCVRKCNICESLTKIEKGQKHVKNITLFVLFMV